MSNEFHSLGHPHHGQTQTACHRNLIPLDHGVGKRGVKRLTRQGRHNLNAVEARLDNGPLTGRNNAPSNAAARPRRVDEKCPNARRIALRVKLRILYPSALVASVERPALAPSATAYNLSITFHDEVGAVANKMAVNGKHWPQRRLHLDLRVIRSLQRSDRQRNEFLQCRDVIFSCQSRRPIHPCLGRRGHSVAPPGAVKVWSTMLPVLRVCAGSNTRTSASVSAIVRCSTPRGTTQNSPGCKVTRRSRNSTVIRPHQTRKNSSSRS